MAKYKYNPNDRLGPYQLLMVERVNGQRAVFLCRCGREWEAQIKHVVSGQYKSCGCQMNQPKYNPGDMFNGTMLLTRRENEKALFRCHCGREWETNLYQVTSGTTESCGCLTRHQVGDVFNGITLLGRLPSGRGRFLCHCGQQWETPIGTVTTGRTKSCGCANQYNPGELVGPQEIRLVRRVSGSAHPKAVFECPICGDEWETVIGNIAAGSTVSCGCQLVHPRIEHPDNALNLPHKFVALSRGQYSKIAADLFEIVNQFYWCARQAPNSDNYYADGWLPGWGRKPLHQFILELRGVIVPPGYVIDHQNHDTLDNTEGNLRVCTRSENARNRRSAHSSTSRFLGVYRDGQRGRWRVCIEVDGETLNLGRHDSEIQAAMAYDWMATIEHGRFANPNFPGLFSPESQLSYWGVG